MVGFGTVMSPLANWMITGLAALPGSGCLRMMGAYETGLPDCCTHSVRSNTCWMAIAPGTVLTTGGRSRSGMFSLNSLNGVGAGVDAAKACGVRERDADQRRGTPG